MKRLSRDLFGGTSRSGLRAALLSEGAWRDFSADMLLVLAARLGLRPTLKLAAQLRFREAARSLGHEFHNT
jgi:hypothetical protein